MPLLISLSPLICTCSVKSDTVQTMPLYRIVDERDLSEATQRMQAHLDAQSTTPHVVNTVVNADR